MVQDGSVGRSELTSSHRHKKYTSTYKITPEKDSKTGWIAPPQQRIKGLHQDQKAWQSLLKNPTMSMTKYNQEGSKRVSLWVTRHLWSTSSTSTLETSTRGKPPKCHLKPMRLISKKTTGVVGNREFTIKGLTQGLTCPGGHHKRGSLKSS